MKKISCISSFLLTILLIIFPVMAFAGSATISWEPNTEADLQGYRVYYGTSEGGPYGSSTPLIPKILTNYEVTDLDPGTYYFVVVAVDNANNESAWSDEVSKIIAGTTIPLPASGTYGWVGGDPTQFNEVSFTFEGRSGDVIISYEGFDIDNKVEVGIFVNGQSIGNAVGVNMDWGGEQNIIAPDSYVNDSTGNTLTFSNIYNPPNVYQWGVRNISIVEATTIPLPASGTYGWVGGDPTQFNEVSFTFEGRSGDVIISYEGFDIDNKVEVGIFVNGQSIGNAVGVNMDWGGEQNIIAPDSYVNDSTGNTLTFSNIYNPPNVYQWGVRNISIVEATTIPLPASGTYGWVGGDPTQYNEVSFTFEGRSGDVIISYEAFDIDNKVEVGIFVNGQSIGNAVGVNMDWGGEQNIIAPDSYVNDSTGNTLTFSNIYNPPNVYQWGVRNINIQ